MSVFDTMRNGLRFLLMSMGISSPTKKKPVNTTPKRDAP
jgi:hypothetical protein